MKKLLIMLFITILPFLNLSHASAEDMVCPSPELIKEKGLDEMMMLIGGTKWIGIKHHEFYDTQEYWNFAVWPIEAHGKKEALHKALPLINNLILVEKGYATDNITKLCSYDSDNKKVMIWATTGKILGYDHILFPLRSIT